VIPASVKTTAGRGADLILLVDIPDGDQESAYTEPRLPDNE